MTAARDRRVSVAAGTPNARQTTRTRGRKPATPRFPIHIRATGMPIDQADRDYLRRKVDLRLAKFVPSIERVSVRVGDANGPRGGVDKTCAIKVVLPHAPSVVFTAQNASLKAAMDGALHGVARAVRRLLQRRHDPPR